MVMPVWNEHPTVARLVDELRTDVADRLDQVEIVVVDDASTDGSGELLAELAGSDGRLRLVRLDVNRGHGPAVLEGLRRARGAWIFQLDSDGQFVIDDFWKLWAQREHADLVLGRRADRHDPRHRLLLSRIVAVVVSLLSGRRVNDPNVPFRLLSRPLWNDLAPLLPGDALAPSILTVVGAAVRGWRIVEVPVRHRARERGTSSLRRLRLVRFSLRGLVQLVRFRAALARASSRGR
jgi:glycosyltransferase involved in cell wall biosynthesis